MSESQSDQSTSSSDNSSIGGDASNRSERSELSSAADSQETRATQSSDDGQRLEASRSEAPAAEATRSEGPNRSEAPAPEANRSDGPRPEASRSEAPAAEANRSEAPAAETTRSEGPNRSEAPAPEANRSDGPRLESGRPESLTREQVERIAGQSRSLDDFKLNLGLGPVTDRALGGHLASKGFGVSDATRDEPRAPDADGHPSIGPARDGMPVSQLEAERQGVLDALDASQQSAVAGLMAGLAALQGRDGQEVGTLARAGQAAGELSIIARPMEPRSGPAEGYREREGEQRKK